MNATPGCAWINASLVAWIYSTANIASVIKPVPAIATEIRDISMAYLPNAPLPAARQILRMRTTKWPYFATLKFNVNNISYGFNNKNYII